MAWDGSTRPENGNPTLRQVITRFIGQGCSSQRQSVTTRGIRIWTIVITVSWYNSWYNSAASARWQLRPFEILEGGDDANGQNQKRMTRAIVLLCHIYTISIPSITIYTISTCHFPDLGKTHSLLCVDGVCQLRSKAMHRVVKLKDTPHPWQFTTLPLKLLFDIQNVGVPNSFPLSLSLSVYLSS